MCVCVCGGCRLTIVITLTMSQLGKTTKSTSTNAIVSNHVVVKNNSNRRQRQGQQLHQQQPRIVLSEEEYTSTLSSIVQRDYFPELSNLERQAAVLEHRSRDDATGAIAVRRAARQLLQHEENLKQQEKDEEYDTELATSHAIVAYSNNDGRSSTTTKTTTTEIRKNPRPLHRETITGFHARVTNEDDHEFHSNQTQEIKDHREYLQQVLQGIPSNSSKKGRQASNETPLLEFQMASDSFEPVTHINNKKPPSTPSTSSSTSQAENSREQPPAMIENGLFFVPTRSAATASSSNVGEAGQATAQPALAIMGPPTNKDKSKATATNPATALVSTSRADAAVEGVSSSSSSNHQVVMYNTDNNDTTDSNSKNTTNQPIIFHKSNLVEYIPKHTLEKKIEPSQTRFPSTAYDPTNTNRRVVPFFEHLHGEINAEMKNHNSDGHDTDTNASTDLDSIGDFSLSRERRAYQQRKTRELNTLIQMSPLVKDNNSDDGAAEAAAARISTFEIPVENTRDIAARQAQQHLERRARRAREHSSSTPSDDASVSSMSTMGSTASYRSKNKIRQPQPAQPMSLARKRLISSLTPAARSLLESQQQNSGGIGQRSKLLDRPSSRARDAFGSALRGSYMQQQQQHSSKRHKSTSSSSRGGTSGGRDHAYQATPQLLGGGSSSSRNMNNSTPRR